MWINMWQLNVDKHVTIKTDKLLTMTILLKLINCLPWQYYSTDWHVTSPFYMPISTKVVSLNPQDITEVLLKVALNTINKTNLFIIQEINLQSLCIWQLLIQTCWRKLYIRHSNFWFPVTWAHVPFFDPRET
jgi:hypothetical protein